MASQFSAGGYALRRGETTAAESSMLLNSPLSLAVDGHAAWRFEPSYVHLNAHQPVIAHNRGGRLHALTRVAQFGGGWVPPLSFGLQPAPECLLGPGEQDPYAVLPSA